MHSRAATGKIPALLLCMWFVAACSPSLSIDSELETQISDLKDVMKCRHLGNVEVAVKPQLYSLDKGAGMPEDLLVKARNIASEVGADTVVPYDEIDDGKQTFRLYLCNTKTP